MFSNSDGQNSIKRSWSCNSGFARRKEHFCQWEFVALQSGDNKCKKLRDKKKCINIVHGWIRLQIEESGQAKIEPIWLTYRICSAISNAIVLSSFFPDICWWSFCYVLLFGKFCCFLSYICTLFLFLFFLAFWVFE